MKKSIFFLFTCFMTFNSANMTIYPQAEVGNGIIHIRCYLPDSDSGYYRGTRFDWSGVMPSLQVNGHSFCGKWFENYDPRAHDAVMGPVESFEPLGYDEAKAGESFMQIGVGVLSKPDQSAYSPYRYYSIVDPGKWEVRQRSSSISFVHSLKNNGYSYLYTKSIILQKGKPIFVLSHALKNTGVKTIETNVYDHNLFVFDQQPTGPSFSIKFPFKLMADPQDQQGVGLGGIAEIKGKQIAFNRELVKEKKEQVYTILHGFGNLATDYNIQIENHKTGTAIRITCDRPVSKLIFWASPATFSPEPYIHLKINPGEVFRWNISYQFSTCSTLP